MQEIGPDRQVTWYVLGAVLRGTSALGQSGHDAVLLRLSFTSGCARYPSLRSDFEEHLFELSL
jgi:hypothetical protein